ncbi:uroporphyrinogen-III synthase [Stenotrophomonas sp. ISL-67]|uniref:uroporphyrinogen-III synthase n=1 Tax=Stenotrophomonas sp. ISL-67 TaxID=2819171 RepID=UPI001BE57B8C|nr:uroporphyrinogen-III synthase [Stenotrophomonas sp. ISL-67]MBT2768576.1 uroporphyrinogen-III synthase [Stenotrophomonas sp. ISL-67]
MNSHAHVPDWTLVSLRPRGQHAPLRRAAEPLGAQVIGLSPWALVARHDAATRTALARALGADRVVFSSPAAVHAAARLLPLDGTHAGLWLAVGAGTAAALRGHGAGEVMAPARMDSEGLLDLPALAQLQELRAALVTAPGGRGIIAATLQARGAALERVDVYRRSTLRLPPRQLQRLRRQAAPWVLAVSSAEALSLLNEQLPADLLARLRQAHVVAASERLAALAADAGYARITLAAGPMPEQLARAAHAAITTTASS